MGNEHLPRALLQSWKAPPHQSLPENLGVTQSEADSCEDMGSDRGNGQEGAGRRQVAKGQSLQHWGTSQYSHVTLRSFST